MAKHTILGGKVHVYRWGNSRFWQCSTFMQGRNHRTTTKEESLASAKEFAEDWYLTLRGKKRSGELLTEKTFTHAADAFQKEYEVITEGERSPKWVEGHKARVRLHLLPHLGKMGLSQITAGAVQDYRVERIKNPLNGRQPAYSTLHDEIVTLRLVLKTAIRKGWLDHLPDLSAPYRASGKVVHRAWFSPEEYRKLYEGTRANSKKPRTADTVTWPNSCTTKCSSWQRLVFVPAKPTGLNTGMSRSSKMTPPARRFSKLRSAVNAVWATAKAPPVLFVPFKGWLNAISLNRPTVCSLLITRSSSTGYWKRLTSNLTARAIGALSIPSATVTFRFDCSRVRIGK